MPIALILISVIVIAVGWDSRDGMPASERYRQECG